jgi:hypothetical protein
MPKLSSAQDKKKLTILECADAWAFFTIKIWKEKLQKFHIRRSGRLETSFSKHLSGTPEGENIVVKFQFLYYGKFVDMGVGRGTSTGGVRENKTSRALQGKMLGNRRFPKKWYGRTFFAEVATLKEILAREYAHKGAVRVVENIGDNSIRS